MENKTVSASEDAIIDTNGVCVLVDISKWTVRVWTNRKRNPLPCIRLGHRTKRYSRNAVLAWVTEQQGKN